MVEQRSERVDAVRNRRAILKATEKLIATHGAEYISLDRVAAEAKVGKGTVFRRFGSRTGLFQELLAQRAYSLQEAIETGPPPLGPGSPPHQRLLAFLAELAELATQNIELIAAHERACAENPHTDPTYQQWHRHIRSRLEEINPTLDSDFFSHLLLACYEGEFVRHITAHGGKERLIKSVHDLVTSIPGHR